MYFIFFLWITLFNRQLRAGASNFRHGEPFANAILAAATALSTSAYQVSPLEWIMISIKFFIYNSSLTSEYSNTLSPSATCAIIVSSVGFFVANVLPLNASTNSLLMNNCRHQNKNYLLHFSCQLNFYIKSFKFKLSLIRKWYCTLVYWILISGLPILFDCAGKSLVNSVWWCSDHAWMPVSWFSR